MSELTDIEIDAGLYQVIRANQDLSKSKLLKLIKKHFTGLTTKQITDSMLRLANRITP